MDPKKYYIVLVSQFTSEYIIHQNGSMGDNHHNKKPSKILTCILKEDRNVYFYFKDARDDFQDHHLKIRKAHSQSTICSKFGFSMMKRRRKEIKNYTSRKR